MVRHIILWTLKDGIPDEDRVKREAKESLEALGGRIPGLIKIELITEGLPSSSCHMMLDSAFESAEALKNYAVHPLHQAAADTYVRPFTATRLCMDFEC